jgi:hypothetical protein
MRDLQNSLVTVGGGTTYLESYRLLPQVLTAWQGVWKSKKARFSDPATLRSALGCQTRRGPGVFGFAVRRESFVGLVGRVGQSGRLSTGSMQASDDEEICSQAELCALDVETGRVS